MTVGSEAPSVRLAGGAFTVSVPLCDVANVSRNVAFAAFPGVYDQDWPAASCGDANDPLSATTWWVPVVELWKVTVSPAVTVMLEGVKPFFVIWTVVVAAPIAATTASAANVTSGSARRRF